MPELGLLCQPFGDCEDVDSIRMLIRLTDVSCSDIWCNKDVWKKDLKPGSDIWCHVV